MKPLLIVKTGRTLDSLLRRRGDYENWIADGLGRERDAVRVVSVFEDDALPEPNPAELAGVVITGSSAMVSDREAWSERTASWLARAVGTQLPMLAICYGHQLLAHGLGGRVARNPRGREIGTVEIETLEAARGDALFGDFEDGLRVQSTHVESVLDLPDGARRLASNAADPNHAFSVGTCAWGVQFHPEFDADVIRSYLSERASLLRSEGLDADALLRDVRETPDGPALLRRFAALLRD